MKPRRVVVSLEIETDAKVDELKEQWRWNFNYMGHFFIMEKPKVTVVKLKK